MADIYVSTTGSDTTGTGAAGSPYATVGKACSVMAAGDRVLVKADGVYAVSASLVPASGASGTPSQIEGYGTTVGDGTRATIRASASLGAAILDCSAKSYVTVRNLELDCNSVNNFGLKFSSNYCTAENVKARNYTDIGFYCDVATAVFRRCAAVGGGSSSRGGFLANASGVSYYACAAWLNAGPGFWCLSCAADYTRCAAVSNTGATTDGFFASGTFGPRLFNCAAAGNGRDGVRFDGANSADIAAVLNLAAGGNGGYNVRSATTSWADRISDYNAFYASTSGDRSGWPAGAHDVALSGNPFDTALIAALTADSELDAVFAALRAISTGGGAQLRGAGYPAYLDIGAAQHQDAGGGGGGNTYSRGRVVNAG